ncbi:DUF748 domain-containing protein [Adhaeribacter rhizoryzae]|uniref:DUF748 domain-containing protein n=1 Tax=Adhaeribacter rhizoryzae TaxID=2607907 RepID=A0A5M6DFT8_9BACT|nr:DUF748 domain-containing protein [Adhaeribacter rhizoryzae]KAA5546427.1 DUF748 domain-containing protein [Adhaeribacter rhizoryzae]
MWKTLKKPYKIVLGIILLLLIFRLALPGMVKHYVNKSLDELPGYNGRVADVDLHLYRGAYTLDELVLIEEKGNPKYPFLRIQRTSLAIEWKSVFKGRLVGEVLLENPQLNIVFSSGNKASGNEPTREHWTETVKDLMPITINRLVVNNGKLAYLDFIANPDVKLHINSTQLIALNLANVENTGNKLPSTVTLTGKSIGGGTLKGNMKVNALKEIPDFNLDMQLTNVNLTSLNSFIKAYGKFDVERGQMDMYSEVKLTNGQLDGYIKPFFENIKVLNWKKDKKEEGFLHAAKEAIIGLFTEAAENQPRDQIATVVPISGHINQPNTDNWKTFVNVLKHAFINAFNKGIEGKIQG